MIILLGGKIPDDESRKVRRLRSTENMPGPGIGVAALYWAISPDADEIVE